MEIIKSGKKDTKKYTCKCNICGCEFKYIFKEVNNKCVDCPDCGTQHCHINEGVTNQKQLLLS